MRLLLISNLYPRLMDMDVAWPTLHGTGSVAVVQVLSSNTPAARPQTGGER